MKDCVMKLYNVVIVISIVIIVLSSLQLAFQLLNIPKEYPIAIGIYTSIGLASFLIDKADYKKKQNK